MFRAPSGASSSSSMTTVSSGGSGPKSGMSDDKPPVVADTGSFLKQSAQKTPPSSDEEPESLAELSRLELLAMRLQELDAIGATATDEELPSLSVQKNPTTRHRLRPALTSGALFC
jgi:hypothetical protein